MQRGHNRETLHPLFLETATAIDERKKKMQTIVNNKIKKKDKDELNNEQLFFHQPFHPRGISRRFIQETYKSTCESNNEDGENFNELTNEETGETMMIKKLTVAYSRPKNLRDLLSPTKLTEHEHCRVLQFLPNNHFPQAGGTELQLTAPCRNLNLESEFRENN